jgi:hypothetical protein
VRNLVCETLFKRIMRAHRWVAPEMGFYLICSSITKTNWFTFVIWVERFWTSRYYRNGVYMYMLTVF